MVFLAFLFVVAQSVGPSTAHLVASRMQSATIKPSEAYVIGVIDKFETGPRRLVIAMHDGAKVSFVLATDVTVRLGAHTLSAAELASHCGRRAKVRYTMRNGHRTAHWIVVSSEPPRQKSR